MDQINQLKEEELNLVGQSPSSVQTIVSSSTSSASSSSSSNYLDQHTPTITTFSPPVHIAPPRASTPTPIPGRSFTVPIPQVQTPPLGRSQSSRQQAVKTPPPHPPSRQGTGGLYSTSASSASLLERTPSSHSFFPSTSSTPNPSASVNLTANRPSSPLHSPSIHKSLSSLDAKIITQNMEKSTQQANAVREREERDMMAGMQSPTIAEGRPSLSDDVWQSLCIKVLPLFNGQELQGCIEDLNDVLRRCLTEPVPATLYTDIEALLRDGMYTLNAKLFGVSDDKLVSRLVEQWSFFFGQALPYFEGVFLPLRTDVRYRNSEEEEAWNVRTMALRSFRDYVILPLIDRLDEVFAKLFIDFDSDKNPADTAARMLQMTSLLASIPEGNADIDRVLGKLKANWRMFTNRRTRRGFVGIQELRKPNAVPGRIFSPLP